jgi:hypothetical protein
MNTDLASWSALTQQEGGTAFLQILSHEEHQASRIARCREDCEAYAFPSPGRAFIGSIGFDLGDLFMRNICLRDSLFAIAAT